MDESIWKALLLGSAYMQRIAERTGTEGRPFEAITADLRREGELLQPRTIRLSVLRQAGDVVCGDLALFASEVVGTLVDGWAARPDRSVEPHEAASAYLACADRLAGRDALLRAIGDYDPECAAIVRRRLQLPAARSQSLLAALGPGGRRSGAERVHSPAVDDPQLRR